MKKIIYFLIFTFILSNTICNKAFAEIQVKKEQGYISLSNSVTKEIEPNMASVTFSVENTASEAQKAVAENNEISNKIINALKQITTEGTDTIKTTNFSLRPVYSTNSSGKRTIKNYTAQNTIKVETKDTKKVGKFIDTAIANGANRTENLSYTIQNDRTLCNEIYPTLLKELTTTADTLAKSIGAKIDGLKQMNVSCNTDTFVSNGRFYAKAMAQDNSLSAVEETTPVESGKVKVRVYVNADFYVTK